MSSWIEQHQFPSPKLTCFRRGYKVRPHRRRLSSGRVIQVGEARQKEGSPHPSTPPPVSHDDAIETNIRRYERIANATNTILSAVEKVDRIQTRKKALKLRQQSMRERRQMNMLRGANTVHRALVRGQRLKNDNTRLRIQLSKLL